MKSLTREVAEIARYAAKKIFASKRLPTPLVYESEFIDAAQKLKKDRVLKYLLEEEKNLGQQLEMILSEVEGVLSSAQLSISMFEDENRANITSMDQSIVSIKEYSGNISGNTFQKLIDEAVKLQATNHQLMESLAQTSKDLLEKEKAIRDLEYQSQTDPLTQLLNRGSWIKQLEYEFERSKRHGDVFSIIMIDIDHFETFNDFFDHYVGDAVLRKFSSLLKESVRKIDVVFRYGGDKFSILLPETPLKRAVMVAQRIFEEINSATFSDEKNNLKLKVTASFGIADSQSKDSTDAIVKAAEEALYLCKHSGRNCIRTASDLI